jgi:hypothetical protein
LGRSATGRAFTLFQLPTVEEIVAACFVLTFRLACSVVSHPQLTARSTFVFRLAVTLIVLALFCKAFDVTDTVADIPSITVCAAERLIVLTVTTIPHTLGVVALWLAFPISQ